MPRCRRARLRGTNIHIVTGFQPFRGAPLNPAMVMAQELAAHTDATAIELPVTFAGAFDHLLAQLAGRKPTTLLLLGRAAGEPGLRIEQFGRRVCDSPHPDNAGHYGQHATFAPGPDQLSTSIEVSQLIAHCQHTVPSCPVRLSTDAGGYVCNALYYQALLHFRQLPVVFVHLDGLSQLLGANTLPSAQVTDRGQIADTPTHAEVSWAELRNAMVALAQKVHRT